MGRAHQTGRNSGVVHAGIYYPPGSLKACSAGAAWGYCGRTARSARSRSSPAESWSWRSTRASSTRLRELERRATANGVPGVRWVGGDELHAIEPHAAGIAGIHSPTTGIVDYRAVAEAFANDVRRGRRHSEIRNRGGARSRRDSATVRIATADDELEFDLLVLWPGLQADRLARLAGDEHEPTIVPFRGEYYRLTPSGSSWSAGCSIPSRTPPTPSSASTSPAASMAVSTSAPMLSSPSA